MEIQLLPFDKPSASQYLDLLNSKAVQKHMPLSEDHYSLEWVEQWIRSKSHTWPDPESGPWSVWINDEFAGWAGIEPFDEACSLGVVLLQQFWGSGKAVLQAVCEKIRTQFPNVTELQIELPLSRGSDRYASRLGLERIGEIEIAGSRFLTYRLPLT